MARSGHVDTTLLIAWSLLALVVVGCPGGDPESLPCNRNADCPAGEVCKDGQCTPREALRPDLDAMTVGDSGIADRVVADAHLVADGARSDLAPADLGGRDQGQVPDSGGGLDAAAPRRRQHLRWPGGRCHRPGGPRPGRSICWPPARRGRLVLEPALSPALTHRTRPGAGQWPALHPHASPGGPAMRPATPRIQNLLGALGILAA
ncbi:MAG: hypothetical protein ABIJ09_10780, partial [Pseudomonadota bacterium]